MISFLGVRTDEQMDRRTEGQTDRQIDRQTDTDLESSYGNMSAHKKISTQSSKLMVSRRSLYASPEDGDA